LQTIALAAERIMSGFATAIVAGGTEHMSSTLEMPDFSPNPKLVETNPAVYMGMGLTAEQVARQAGKSVSALYAEAIEAHVKALRRKQAIEEINSLIGNTYVAPDFDEQLERMRQESDRDFE
jgi:acetyl-CoA acyltransferase